ncbi:hypothetical protein Tco_0080968, partial [Tanacetum coccineum]
DEAEELIVVPTVAKHMQQNALKLTDSVNYIPVSLENQTNPHAGTSEVTNNEGTLQTPYANASEEEDEAGDLIVVPTVAKHTAAKVRPRKSSTNSKAEEFLTELQNLKIQEKEAYPIHIDNESRICIVKNLVYHSKIKHIEIRHHFIRDSYEKKLIRVEKIHTDFNVADLLTKAFDGPRFNFLVVNIGMINP